MVGTARKGVEGEVGRSSRRHDLDALRVFAFGLLILYHVGMFYVAWPWHVKSPHAPVSAIELPMRLMSSWRLPLLFLISGVALRFALDKARRSASPFTGRRALRLGLPLLFGMCVIVPPQTYLELRQSGVIGPGVAEFYAGYIAPPGLGPSDWPMITPTWNHLWYLAYVLIYTLVWVGGTYLLGRFGTLSTVAPPPQKTLALAGLFVGIPALLLALRALLAESYGADQSVWGDWHNLVVSGLYFGLGAGVAKSAWFWDALKSRRVVMYGAAALATIGVFIWPSGPVAEAVRVLHGWFVVLACLCLAQEWVTAASPTLRYLSDAIFPVYVVHQTVIIVVGVALAPLGLMLAVEATVVVAAAFLGSLAIYHLVVRRMGRAAWLLGGR